MSASAPANHGSAFEVRRELQAIVQSAEFAGSERMCQFLEFVVEQHLLGNAESLKETVIGVAVFHRKPGYDPKLEPIVRTEARRLRAKLQHYYETAGRGHSVRIMVPKGGYAPVVEILRQALLTMPVSAEPLPASPPMRPALFRWRTLAPAVFVLLAVAATAILMLLRSPQLHPGTPVEITVTSFPGYERWPTFSPDGSQLAFSWDGEAHDNNDIYVTMTAGGMPRRLTTNPLPDEAPAWSPDGSSIAFVRDFRDVILISPLGGPERKVATAAYPSLAWSADSQSLAFVGHAPDSDAYSIFLLSLRTGQVRAMTHPPSGVLGDYQMAFSPDGQHMGFARCGLGMCDLDIMPVDGGQPRRIIKATGGIRGLVWTPDSRDLLFACGDSIYHRLWRVSASHPSAPVLVPGTGDDATWPAIVRTGPGNGNRVQLAYTHEQFVDNIWSLDVAGSALRNPAQRFMSSTQIDSSPQFSPDGRKVAFSSTRTGVIEEIWECDSDGRNATRLTSFSYGACGSPRWSPDGSQIAFDYLNQQGRAIFVIPAVGGPVHRLTAYGELGRPSWSRDSRWVYFFGQRAGQNQVYKVAADSSEQHLREPVQVTNGGGLEAYESLDGTTLYYTRDHELWSQPVGGGAAVRVLAYIRHGWWAVTREGIVFVDMRVGAGTDEPKPVELFDLRTRRLTTLGSLTGILHPYLPDFCVSPDFHRILYVRAEFDNAEIRMLINPQ